MFILVARVFPSLKKMLSFYNYLHLSEVLANSKLAAKLVAIFERRNKSTGFNIAKHQTVVPAASPLPRLYQARSIWGIWIWSYVGRLKLVETIPQQNDCNIIVLLILPGFLRIFFCGWHCAFTMSYTSRMWIGTWKLKSNLID